MDCEAQLDDEINKLMAHAQPCSTQSFEDMLDYIEQRTITYRMFRNEFVAPSHFKGRKHQRHPDSSPNNLLNAKGKRPFTMYYVPLPSNRSLFTIDEMQDLFAVFTSDESNPPTVSQIQTFTNSQEKLKAEYSEFLTVVKQRWTEDQWLRTREVKDEVVEFVATWWKNRIPRVRNYPQNYKQVSSIPLTPSSRQLKMTYLKTLFSKGRPAKYWSNSKNRVSQQTHSPTVLKEMTKNEIFYGQYSSSDDLFKEISQDPVAEKLAVDNQAQLVLTPSTLATLLANNPLTYEECWCIPFVIKEYHSDVKKDSPGEHPRKIIYFDKKFAPESLTAVQKNWIHAKYAVRLINLSPANYWKKLNEEKPSMKEEDVIEPEEGEAECSDSEKTAGGEESSPQYHQYRIFQKQVHYNLWECSSADPEAVLSKHHKKPFKVLIKTPVRGQVPVKNKNPTPDTVYPMNRGCTLLPKLDYQPEYGAQVISFSEITREWVHTMLRPNSILHRVRVDPVQGNTIMIEQKSAVELANDCMRHHGHSIQNQLSILQNLMDTLGNLPPGNYLLNHQVKDHVFMFVYHEQTDQNNASSRANLNLWELYDGVDTTTTAQKTAPWVPIDTAVITPTFHTLTRIPCVFAPVRNENKKRRFTEGKPLPFKPNRKKRNNKKPSRNKKKEAAADAAAADKSSQTRKRIPYHDVDSVTDELTSDIS